MEVDLTAPIGVAALVEIRVDEGSVGNHVEQVGGTAETFEDSMRDSSDLGFDLRSLPRYGSSGEGPPSSI